MYGGKANKTQFQLPQDTKVSHLVKSIGRQVMHFVQNQQFSLIINTLSRIGRCWDDGLIDGEAMTETRKKQIMGPFINQNHF